MVPGPGPEEEFANFLELGDLQLDFSPFEGVGQDGGTTQQDVDVAMDTGMDNAPHMVDLGMGSVINQPGRSTPIPLGNNYHGSAEQVYHMQSARDHYGRHHQSQATAKLPGHYAPGMVPPTPNSIELHGGIPGYYQTPMHPHAPM